MNDFLFTQQVYGDVETKPERAFERGCLQVIALLLGTTIAFLLCLLL